MRFSTLTHVSTEPVEGEVALLSFSPGKPLRYAPGQFGLWIVGAAARPFTIASSPLADRIQLATHLHEGSGIKRALSRLRPGDKVRLLGPIGKGAPPAGGAPLVHVTQGIGITTARSMLHSPSTGRQSLIHVGTPYFRAELEPLAAGATYLSNRGQLESALADVARAEPFSRFVVSGSAAFVRGVSETLRRLGVRNDHIRSDSFIGLPDLGRARLTSQSAHAS
jgi:ferredoxin-NADP reductase